MGWKNTSNTLVNPQCASDSLTTMWSAIQPQYLEINAPIPVVSTMVTLHQAS